MKRLLVIFLLIKIALADDPQINFKNGFLGVGFGSGNTASQRLDVNGAIKLGGTDTYSEGTIRFQNDNYQISINNEWQTLLTVLDKIELSSNVITDIDSYEEDGVSYLRFNLNDGSSQITSLGNLYGGQGIQGIQGIQGDKGDQGDVGPSGNNGLSNFALWLDAGNSGNVHDYLSQNTNYEVWLDSGYTGNIHDYFEFLKGDKGDQGDVGPVGPEGPIGPIGLTGLSNYDLWLDAGNSGNIHDYFFSLKGDVINSNYDVWLDAGNSGNVYEFLESSRGDVGPIGKSNYEVWRDNGNPDGTIEEFLAAYGSTYRVNFEELERTGTYAYPLRGINTVHEPIERIYLPNDINYTGNIIDVIVNDPTDSLIVNQTGGSFSKTYDTKGYKRVFVKYFVKYPNDPVEVSFDYLLDDPVTSPLFDIEESVPFSTHEYSFDGSLTDLVTGNLHVYNKSIHPLRYTFDRKGRNRSALLFEKDRGNDFYLTDLNKTQGTGNVTFMYWIKKTTAVDNGDYMEMSLGTMNSTKTYQTTVGLRSLSSLTYDNFRYRGDGNSSRRYLQIPVLADGGWNHIAYVVDDNEDSMAGYLNGEYLGKTSDSTFSYKRFDSIHITNDNSFILDDLAVYHEVLSGNQINWIYQSSK